MLTLYLKPTCPYCQRVLAAAEDLGVKFNLKDISTDDAIAAELIEKGGKRQVPYLVDDEHDVAMYESSDIVEYLQQHHATDTQSTGSFSGLRIHKSDDSCDSCQ